MSIWYPISGVIILIPGMLMIAGAIDLAFGEPPHLLGQIHKSLVSGDYIDKSNKTLIFVVLGLLIVLLSIKVGTGWK